MSSNLNISDYFEPNYLIFYSFGEAKVFVDLQEKQNIGKTSALLLKIKFISVHEKTFDLFHRNWKKLNDSK